MEEVHSRAQQLGKKRKYKKYKRGSSRIQGKNECKSKITGEVKYGRKKRLQKGRATREVYNKNVIQMG